MATSITLKELNMELVKNALKSRESATKNDISNSTGLSVATCGNILRELLITGEVLEIDHAESTGGRPSRQFVYNKNFSYVLSLYIKIEFNSTELFYSVSDLLGEIIDEKFIKHQSIKIAELDKLIEFLYDKYPQIKVISFGIPGIVKDGIIERAHCSDVLKNLNFSEEFQNKFDEYIISENDILSELNLFEHLKKKYDIEIVIENDINCAALGYYNKKNLSEKDSIVYVYFPSDIFPGSGLIINGKIHYGYTNFAGEVSFLPDKNEIDEEKMEWKNRDLFAQYVSNIIISIDCIVNPKIIVISGPKFTDSIYNSIEKKVRLHLPEKHIPILILEKDYHESYVNGLITLALEKLACNIKIIEI